MPERAVIMLSKRMTAQARSHKPGRTLEEGMHALFIPPDQGVCQREATQFTRLAYLIFDLLGVGELAVKGLFDFTFDAAAKCTHQKPQFHRHHEQALADLDVPCDTAAMKIQGVAGPLPFDVKALSQFFCDMRNSSARILDGKWMLAFDEDVGHAESPCAVLPDHAASGVVAHVAGAATTGVRATTRGGVPPRLDPASRHAPANC